jgi:outer membrane protein
MHNNKLLLQILFLCFWLSGSYAQEVSFTLPQAITYALENHPSLKDASLDGKNAEWQYKEALSIGMPHINGNLDYTYYYQVPITPTADFITPIVSEAITGQPYTGETQYFELAFLQKNQLTAGIRGEVLVFDGNFLKGLKASKLFIDLAKKQIQLNEQDIKQNVVRAYHNVLIGQRNIEIIDNNAANIENILRETQTLYENGFVEELDVDRLRLSFENLITEREKLLQVIEVGYNVLKFQMGYPINQSIKVEEDLEQLMNTMLLIDEGLADQIDYSARPEHRLLVDAIELDYADLDRIKQGYIPSVSASAGYNQSLQRNNLFDGSETGFLANGNVALKARIPIYDGGYTKAKIQQKLIEIEKREISLSEFDRGMQLQIYNAMTQYSNAKKSLESAKKSLELNEKIFNKTQIKYREGVGSSIEVSQAEGSLYQSQANYINALYDVLTTRTELSIASGELLKK